jgi:hypothetical protein
MSAELVSWSLHLRPGHLCRLPGHLKCALPLPSTRRSCRGTNASRASAFVDRWSPPAPTTALQQYPRLIAVTAVTINVVGGFMITDRMLRMFKKKEPAKSQGPGLGGRGVR